MSLTCVQHDVFGGLDGNTAGLLSESLVWSWSWPCFCRPLLTCSLCKDGWHNHRFVFRFPGRLVVKAPGLMRVVFRALACQYKRVPAKHVPRPNSKGHDDSNTWDLTGFPPITMSQLRQAGGDGGLHHLCNRYLITIVNNKYYWNSYNRHISTYSVYLCRLDFGFSRAPFEEPITLWTAMLLCLSCL